MGISTVSKPHCLNCLNSLVLSLVNGEVKRKGIDAESHNDLEGTPASPGVNRIQAKLKPNSQRAYIGQ